MIRHKAVGSTIFRGVVSLKVVPPSRLSSTKVESLASCKDTEKIYELRIYDIKPKFFKSFVEFTRKNLHIRLKHSRCLGYWFNHFNGFNQALHLWDFESYAHRAEVRASIASDKEMNDHFLPPILSMLHRQDNRIFRLVPGTTVSYPEKSAGVYELVSYKMKPIPPSWLPKVPEATEKMQSVLKPFDAKILAAFVTEFGPVNELLYLVNFQNFDSRAKCYGTIMNNVEFVQMAQDWSEIIREAHNNGMTPCPGLSLAFN